MMLLLVMLTTMVSIALASYLHEKRHGSSRAIKANAPDIDSDVGFVGEDHHHFEAGDDAD